MVGHNTYVGIVLHTSGSFKAIIEELAADDIYTYRCPPDRCRFRFYFMTVARTCANDLVS
jgi:hypothetical protein